jgi:hypothetical protein
MAIGIPIGFGAGLAAGMASGRRKASEDVRDYVQAHSITIQDGQGAPIPIDKFLDEALRTEVQRSKKIAFALVLLLGILFFLGVLVFRFRMFWIP